MPGSTHRQGRVTVSVVIPAYNAERWIAETLISVSEQTLREIEILVVDDGSSDHTAAIVERHACSDPRIRLIRQRNSGVGAARNAAIRQARGEFVAPIDSDDLWYPEKLALQVSRMREGGEDLGLVYCWSEKVDATGTLITGAHPFQVEGRVLEALIVKNFVGNASTPLFRASALRNTGVYLTREEQGGVEGCEDWDLSLRMAESFKVGCATRTLVKYRQIPTCMTLNVESMSRSYECVMQRARRRNPAVESLIFRNSAGNFYNYMLSRCYLSGDYAGCLRSMFRAVRADVPLLASRRTCAMAVKSLIRLAVGNGGAAAPSLAISHANPSRSLLPR
jgi:glycosyltransferase involved in cell wall biosynthesis